MQCQFTRKDHDVICSRCGRIIKNYDGPLDRLHANCRVDDDGNRIEPTLPSLTQRAKNLTGAIGRIAKSKGKRRTQEEQDKCLTICRDCDKYNHKRKACSICGCNCNAHAKLLNKLAWESEHCPEGKW